MAEMVFAKVKEALDAVGRASATPVSSDEGLDNVPLAPSFHPTEQEFRDPLAYIQSIRAKAEPYGIARVVPPASWKPPFAWDHTNPELKFRTRIQRVDQLQRRARGLRVNKFVSDLLDWHHSLGMPLTEQELPVLDDHELRLYDLYIEVLRLGGWKKVEAGQKWEEICAHLGIRDAHASRVRRAYDKLLKRFADKVAEQERSKASQQHLRDWDVHKTSTGTPYYVHKVTGKTQWELPTGAGIAGRLWTEFSSSGGQPYYFNTVTKEAVWNKPPDFDAFVPAPAVVPAAEEEVSLHLDRGEKKDLYQDTLCELCKGSDHDEKMVLCDQCDAGFHTFCLFPPLDMVPSGHWYCPDCTALREQAFGFKEGRTYTVQEFRSMANRFAVEWWQQSKELGWMPQDATEPFICRSQSASDQDYVPPNPVRMDECKSSSPRKRQVTETAVPLKASLESVQYAASSHVEKDFWKIVEQANFALEATYGSDLDSTMLGSGFPSRGPYAEDGWNLSNLPLRDKSVLHFLDNESISGVTQPWIYVGALFSCFCWHNEDHLCYSINYLHRGAPKQWYGVPGLKATAMEATMRKLLPELFNSQPDLLFQLVTMVSPAALMGEGVPVFKTIQEAGQFVITFPASYHAGFNLGFNIAEAVNFATADWFSFGVRGADKYRNFRRTPVFSHDLLLCRVIASQPDVHTVAWVSQALAHVVERERHSRLNLLASGVVASVRWLDGKTAATPASPHKDSSGESPKKGRRKARIVLPADRYEVKPPPGAGGVNSDVRYQQHVWNGIGHNPHSEKEKHCVICRALVHVAAVVCLCDPAKYACAQHWKELCGCPVAKRVLKFRYSLKELDDMRKYAEDVCSANRNAVASMLAHSRIVMERLPGSDSPPVVMTTEQVEQWYADSSRWVSELIEMRNSQDRMSVELLQTFLLRGRAFIWGDQRMADAQRLFGELLTFHHIAKALKRAAQRAPTSSVSRLQAKTIIEEGDIEGQSGDERPTITLVEARALLKKARECPVVDFGEAYTSLKREVERTTLCEQRIQMLIATERGLSSPGGIQETMTGPAPAAVRTYSDLNSLYLEACRCYPPVRSLSTIKALHAQCKAWRATLQVVQKAMKAARRGVETDLFARQLVARKVSVAEAEQCVVDAPSFLDCQTEVQLIVQALDVVRAVSADISNHPAFAASPDKDELEPPVIVLDREDDDEDMVPAEQVEGDFPTAAATADRLSFSELIQLASRVQGIPIYTPELARLDNVLLLVQPWVKRASDLLAKLGLPRESVTKKADSEFCQMMAAQVADSLAQLQCIKTCPLFAALDKRVQVFRWAETCGKNLGGRQRRWREARVEEFVEEAKKLGLFNAASGPPSDSDQKDSDQKMGSVTVVPQGPVDSRVSLRLTWASVSDLAARVRSLLEASQGFTQRVSELLPQLGGAGERASDTAKPTTQVIRALVEEAKKLEVQSRVEGPLRTALDQTQRLNARIHRALPSAWAQEDALGILRAGVDALKDDFDVEGASVTAAGDTGVPAQLQVADQSCVNEAKSGNAHALIMSLRHRRVLHREEDPDDAIFEEMSDYVLWNDASREKLLALASLASSLLVQMPLCAHLQNVLGVLAALRCRAQELLKKLQPILKQYFVQASRLLSQRSVIQSSATARFRRVLALPLHVELVRILRSLAKCRVRTPEGVEASRWLWGVRTVEELLREGDQGRIVSSGLQLQRLLAEARGISTQAAAMGLPAASVKLSPEVSLEGLLSAICDCGDSDVAGEIYFRSLVAEGVAPEILSSMEWQCALLVLWKAYSWCKNVKPLVTGGAYSVVEDMTLRLGATDEKDDGVQTQNTPKKVFLLSELTDLLVCAHHLAVELPAVGDVVDIYEAAHDSLQSANRLLSQPEAALVDMHSAKLECEVLASTSGVSVEQEPVYQQLRHRVLACEEFSYRLSSLFSPRPQYLELHRLLQSISAERNVSGDCVCHNAAVATIACTHCGRCYHHACMNAPVGQSLQHFKCPTCCARAKELYPFGDPVISTTCPELESVVELVEEFDARGWRVAFPHNVLRLARRGIETIGLWLEQDKILQFSRGRQLSGRELTVELSNYTRHVKRGDVGIETPQLRQAKRWLWHLLALRVLSGKQDLGVSLKQLRALRDQAAQLGIRDMLKEEDSKMKAEDWKAKEEESKVHASVDPSGASHSKRKGDSSELGAISKARKTVDGSETRAVTSMFLSELSALDGACLRAEEQQRCAKKLCRKVKALRKGWSNRVDALSGIETKLWESLSKKVSCFLSECQPVAGADLPGCLAFNIPQVVKLDQLHKQTRDEVVQLQTQEAEIGSKSTAEDRYVKCICSVELCVPKGSYVSPAGVIWLKCGVCGNAQVVPEE